MLALQDPSSLCEPDLYKTVTQRGGPEKRKKEFQDI